MKNRMKKISLSLLCTLFLCVFAVSPFLSAEAQVDEVGSGDVDLSREVILEDSTREDPDPEARYRDTSKAGSKVTRYGGLVQCDGVVTDSSQVKCDFNALIASIKHILKWLINIGVAIAVVLFAYAGILYMTGVPKNISKAKSVLPTVAKGFIIMLSAWLVVYTLLSWISRGTEYTTLLKGDF